MNQILIRNPETPRNTIHGSVWNLDAVRPAEVRKPSRGLYVAVGATEAPEPSKPKVREDEFYESFAEWLKHDLDEVTDVVALGGATFRAKWGTPDVLGVYKPLASNLVKFPLEIVAGEVKVATSEAITAFGQAVANRLFAAKTYIAMPTAIPEDDLGRLGLVERARSLSRCAYPRSASTPVGIALQRPVDVVSAGVPNCVGAARPQAVRASAIRDGRAGHILVGRCRLAPIGRVRSRPR